MTDSVTLLGAKGGPALNPASPTSRGQNPTSSLVALGDRRIVVDCGLGASRGLVGAGVALRELDLVFVTHLHSDHVLELGPLVHTAWTAGLKTPVRVFGPHGLADYWRHFVSSMAFDIDLRVEDEGRPDLRDLVDVLAIDDGFRLDADGVVVTALRNDHPPVADSFALRFDGAHASFCFSGDTAYFPPLADFARDVDLLVHEAMLPEGVDALVARVGNGDDRLRQHIARSHTAAAGAGRIAAAAGAKALALHHLVPGDDRAFCEADWEAAAAATYAGPIFVGRDGLRIALPAAEATP